MRHGWAHSPLLPLRPPIAKLSLQRPLYETQSAPCTKHSKRVDGLRAAEISEISRSESSRATTIVSKPHDSKNFAFSGVVVWHCVLEWIAIGGSPYSSSPKS